MLPELKSQMQQSRVVRTTGSLTFAEDQATCEKETLQLTHPDMTLNQWSETAMEKAHLTPLW